jgi:hypothetical protein
VRAFLVLASSVLLAIVAFLTYELRAGQAQPPVIAMAAPREPTTELPVHAALPPPPGDARPQVAKAVNAIAPALETPRDFDRYVESMEQRARREHRLAAADVQPGFEAIRRMRSKIGAERTMQLQAEYIQKLNRLSDELEPR